MDKNTTLGESSIPKRPWRIRKFSTVVAGIALIILGVLASGSLWPILAPSTIDTGELMFTVLLFLVLVISYAACTYYTRGLWRSAVIWGILALVVALIGMFLVRTLDFELPDSTHWGIPKLVVLVLGFLLTYIGIWRDTDTLHGKESNHPTDWFTQTSRILQANYFWSPEQADQQVQRAHAEYNHAAAHQPLSAGKTTEPTLSPQTYFGTPEEYALSVHNKPHTSPDPLRSTRWYYLSTAIIIEALALYRGLTAPMNWLTVVLYILAIMALGMFIWSSIIVHRRR